MHSTPHSSIPCPSCGTVFAGTFCYQCGEKQVHDHEWTWSHFLHHLVHEITHVDAKIFQSLWLLFRRPGFLTAEYWVGRRVPYLTPLRLYLIGAAIHFIAVYYGLFQTDIVKIDYRDASPTDLVQLIARQARIPADRIPEMEHHFQTVYKFTVYLGPLVLALFVWLWFRKKRPYFIQHLIFSTHVYAFWFLMTPLSIGSTKIRSVLAMVTAAYLFFAARRLYGGGFWINLGRAVYLRTVLIFGELTAVGAALLASLLWVLTSQGH